MPPDLGERLSQWLGGSGPEAPKPPDLPTRVNDPHHIAHLLHRAQIEQTLVHVTLPGDDRPWNSAVLRVNEDEGHFLIDELSPRGGHERMRPGVVATLRTVLNGVSLVLHTDVQHVGEGARIAVYRLAIPEWVIYRERRNLYRVRLEPLHTLPFQALERDGRCTLEGEVVDLSTAGLGIKLQRERAIEPGEILPRCRLRLPEGDVLELPLEVRYTQRLERSGALRIGGRLSDLSRAARRRLATATREIERGIRRRG